MHDASLLMALYKKYQEGTLDAEKLYKMVCRATAEALNGTRASIWFFQGTLQDVLVCPGLYDKTTGQWQEGMQFTEDDCGPYFEDIRHNKEILAADAHSEPATACFNDLDFTPIERYSIADVVIEAGGHLYGVIRCERNGQSNWVNDDVVFLKQAAAMLGLVIKNTA